MQVRTKVYANFHKLEYSTKTADSAMTSPSRLDPMPTSPRARGRCCSTRATESPISQQPRRQICYLPRLVKVTDYLPMKHFIDTRFPHAKQELIAITPWCSDLVTYCENQGVPFTTFTNFYEILDEVKAIVEGKISVKDAAKGRK